MRYASLLKHSVTLSRIASTKYGSTQEACKSSGTAPTTSRALPPPLLAAAPDGTTCSTTGCRKSAGVRLIRSCPKICSHACVAKADGSHS